MQGGILFNQGGLKRDADFSWLDVRNGGVPGWHESQTCLNEGEAMAGTKAICAGVNVEVGVKGSDCFHIQQVQVLVGRCEGCDREGPAGRHNDGFRTMEGGVCGFLLDRPGCLETGRETSVRGRT